MAVQDIIEQLEKLSVLDLVELKKTLEERWGVTAAAPVMMGGVMPAGAPGADGGNAPAVVEEPTEFNVILTEIGAEKIKVIKAVRELTALGLKEAKEVVDGAPKPIKEGVNKEEAAKIKQVMEDAGAKVDIKPV